MLSRTAPRTTEAMQWVPFRNDSSEEVPAYGLLRITGAVKDAGELIVTVDKPSTSFQRIYGVNGLTPVAAGAKGSCVMGLEAPVMVAYESATPAYGEGWGPKPGSWKLTKAYYGFTICGANDTTASATFCLQHVVNDIEGKADGAIAADSSGTVAVWTGANAGADTTFTIQAWNRYDTAAAISDDKRVGCTWNGNIWVVRSAECEA